MLLAEIRGKACEGVVNSEDYLTSAVFGHLRYVPPCIFWSGLFAKAKSSSLARRDGSLAQYIAETGHRLSEYSRLDIDFWPYDPKFGEPDFILRLSGTGLTPIIIVFEVKLWARKSGTGEFDQLGKYLDLLNNLEPLRVPVPLKALVYLTLLDSRTEVQETLSSRGNAELDATRLFHLRWQDVTSSAVTETAMCEGVSALVLRDVATFLTKRGYDYFDGFVQDGSLCDLKKSDGAFYRCSNSFTGFRQVESLELIASPKRLLNL